MTFKIDYSQKEFRRDLIAGLTVAAISLPQGMAYALLAGVDPRYGLYSAFSSPQSLPSSVRPRTSSMVRPARSRLSCSAPSRFLIPNNTSKPRKRCSSSA
jgi:SulP family sulfate permease